MGTRYYEAYRTLVVENEELKQQSARRLDRIREQMLEIHRLEKALGVMNENFELLLSHSRQAKNTVDKS